MSRTNPKPVTGQWTERYRMINGERRLVKVRKIAGREQIRIPGVRNTTDKNASRRNRKQRTKDYRNHPDSGIPNYGS